MSRKRIWPPHVYLHKSSGQARIRIDGRDFYLGQSGTPEAEAEYRRVVADYEATGSRPAPQRRGGQTVAMVAAGWLADATRERGADCRELEAYRRTILVLARLFGDIPAEGFGPPELEEVRNAMASGAWMKPEERARLVEKARPVGWCRNVVNRQVVRIGTIWRWAERRQLVGRGAYASLKTVPGLTISSKAVRQTVRKKPASIDDLRAVRRRCPRVVAYMLTVQWWTGMRSGEVCQMRVCDLDRTNPEQWVYRPATHKTQHLGQERAIPLGRLARRIVESLIEGRAEEEYVFQPTQVRRNRRYTRYSYALAVRRAADAAGLPGFHPYLLRHGAKQRITRLFGLDAARAVLGHKSLGTTSGYGDAIDLETACRAMRHEG